MCQTSSCHPGRCPGLVCCSPFGANSFARPHGCHVSLLPVSHNAGAPGREGPTLPALCRQGLVRGSDATENPKPAGYNPIIRSNHRPSQHRARAASCLTRHPCANGQHDAVSREARLSIAIFRHGLPLCVGSCGSLRISFSSFSRRVTGGWETTSVQSWSAVACHRFGRAEQAEHPRDPFSEVAVLGTTKAVASHRTPRSLFGWPTCSPWLQSSRRDERVAGQRKRGLAPLVRISVSGETESGSAGEQGVMCG